ncbi:MAG: hypothetical protein CMH53_10025, partial [Myxococcales bacterium]|nr:hypothetical protein [Myxococcales bacterium]
MRIHLSAWTRGFALIALLCMLVSCGSGYKPSENDAGFQPFDLSAAVDTAISSNDTAAAEDTQGTSTGDVQDSQSAEVVQDATEDSQDAGCVPTTPPEEVCDGVDNDCDGETDNETCDDDDPCTSQKCNGQKAADGEDGCEYAYADGAACDDGSLCTQNDSCKSGACLAGAKVNCDDDNTCTVDACQSTTGKCDNIYLGDGKFCNDGQACTLNDVCTAGVCKGKASGKCDDGNPCTEDGCNDDGSCKNKSVDNLPCDDNNPCTKGDKCFIGICVGNEPTICDDQKPCTDDFCDNKQGGCMFKPKLLGSPCSDGLCTIGGSCDDFGQCINQKPVCDDKTPCTVDSCEPANGKCTHTPLAIGTPCDDGEACTSGEACDATNQCTPPAGQKGCDDGNPCTEDVCNVLNKTCSNKLKIGACDDGDACTNGEACVTGKCVTGGAPLSASAAGTGNGGFQDGNAKTASLNLPRGLDYAGDGNVYIADRNNHRIRTLSTQGQVSTIAGQGTKGMVDGPGSSARFSNPEDVAVSGQGVVYVADAGNQRIRAVSSKAVVSTFAGNGTAGWKDGPASVASFNTPSGIAAAQTGELLIADTYNQRIRMVAKGQVTTLAGGGSSGFVDGAGPAAKFNFPYGVDVGSNGVIYVADSNNNRIRKVTMKGQVTTIAGSGTKGSVNGAALVAQLSAPVDVVALASGAIAIAERDGHAIRLLRADGLLVSVAGSGAPGYAEG